MKLLKASWDFAESGPMKWLKQIGKVLSPKLVELVILHREVSEFRVERRIEIPRQMMMSEFNNTRLLLLATIQQCLLKGVLWLHREIIVLAIAAVGIPGGCCPP